MPGRSSPCPDMDVLSASLAAATAFPTLVSGLGFRVLGFVFGVLGLGFRV